MGILPQGEKNMRGRLGEPPVFFRKIPLVQTKFSFKEGKCLCHGEEL
jgi:hypothetical protein